MVVYLDRYMMGCTNVFKKRNSNYTCEDVLDYVRGNVESTFGKNNVFIQNEHHLSGDGSIYPEYYAAGCFIGKENNSYAVVVAHGKSFIGAQRAMMKAVQNVSWEELDNTIAK